MKYIAVHGRQPEFAIAEIESLYGPANIMPINSTASFVDVAVDFARLGSSVKFADHETSLPAAELPKILDAALPYIAKSRSGREGKLQLGVSIYGKRIHAQQVNRAALSLKKKLRSKGLSVRLIPNKHQELNAAQVLRNKLTKENGYELILVFDGDQVHIAKTMNVQDIDEYTRRDRDKPVRDPLVGMLPPKLAQTLINLANPSEGSTILDPFCGTGTLLIEAIEMGFEARGSDISPDMVEASKKNLAWFQANTATPNMNVELADATRHDWGESIGTVCAETFLGPALRELPDENELAKITNEVDDIHRRFLQNLAPQLASGTKISLAVPAWFKDKVFIRMPVLDDLEKLGYNPSRFTHVKQELVYHRPQQLVGRRILTLIRK